MTTTHDNARGGRSSEEGRATDVAAWLDSIEPDAADARDAVHFRQIVAAREELAAAVAAACAAGDS
jgi:hypothetical protein